MSIRLIIAMLAVAWASYRLGLAAGDLKAPNPLAQTTEYRCPDVEVRAYSF